MHISSNLPLAQSMKLAALKCIGDMQETIRRPFHHIKANHALAIMLA